MIEPLTNQEKHEEQAVCSIFYLRVLRAFVVNREFSKGAKAWKS